MAICDLDFSLITKRKRIMDSIGHYSRPELLQLQVNTNEQTVMKPFDRFTTVANTLILYPVIVPEA